MAQTATKREQYVDPAFWGLNEEQTAAFLDDGSTVVIACPGSGKTRLSIAKAVKFIATLGLSKVLLVTFSRQAADEMRKRLAARVGAEVAAKVKIGTYHGLGHELLRAYYKSKGKSYKVVKEGQARSLMLRARDRIAANITNEEVFDGIAKIKATFLSDDQLAGRTDPLTMIFMEYQRNLAALHGKDFADLVRESTQLLVSGAMKPFPCQHLLADEFQDSDKMNYQWLLAHHAAGANIHAVGDDDQSIYAFRNAMGHIALRGLAQDTGATVHFLRTNYRCGGDIVAIAGQVISENVGRIPKDFKVGSPISGRVVLSTYIDQAAEAEAAILQFEQLVDSGELQPQTNEFAVLTRTNFGLDYLDMAAVGCKYRVVREGGSSFADRPHVAQALAALSLGVDPASRINWFSAVEIAGMSTEGIGRFMEYVQKLPEKANMSDAVYARDWLDGLGKQDRTLFGQFRGALNDWFDAVDLVNEQESPDDEWSAAVVKACTRFADLASNKGHRKDILFLGRVISRLKGPLAKRLLRVSQKDSREDEEQAEGPSLKLMTLHASKGLEFDGVWLVGLNDGTMPIADSDLEEERRLFYVGITRAIGKLHLSYVKSPETKPSRFLDRIVGG